MSAKDAQACVVIDIVCEFFWDVPQDVVLSDISKILIEHV